MATIIYNVIQLLLVVVKKNGLLWRIVWNGCPQINQSIHSMDKPMNRIKEVLEEKGIKQTWLAEKLGKSFCIVNSYVCNRRQPSLEVLFEIAKILQVDPKDLIDSDEK